LFEFGPIDVWLLSAWVKELDLSEKYSSQGTVSGDEAGDA
jgi:hypothetical protein